MAIQTHPKMLDEILTIINNSDDVVASIKMAFRLDYFKKYMEITVSDVWTTITPSELKFTQYNYARSLAGAMLLNKQTWNIVDQIIMHPHVRESAKEVQFKSLSEMLYVEESKILTAILVKDLTSLYQNITHDRIVEALNNAG